MTVNTFARTCSISALFFTCACATPSEPKIVPKEVKVEVTRACVPVDVPAPPTAYADADQSTLSPEERYLAIARANQQRRARLAVVEPVIAGCR